MRRNLIAAGIGGRAVHLLDLQGVGWFGRPDRAGDLEALWANLQSVFRAVDKIRHGGASAYQPQVAVFADDVSPNYQAALTPAGENSYGFAGDQLPNLVEDLTRLGTPVRHYLLSDLTKGTSTSAPSSSPYCPTRTSCCPPCARRSTPGSRRPAAPY
ncbi:hypothetical protein [Saccharothrix syringae]|uniref:Uncharacterized protein n=1 Tax=Saccharothrix syringae TaxID=103733 RepID=A0A5Q0H1Y5_SACSY|nr:hypothetical protein [Saccharothrix syringae]QFZ20113.1 hypothetical protein EKG83_24245 [Saccharothrix syringae]